MAKTKTWVTPSNMYLATDKKLNNNENCLYSNNSFSSQIDEYTWEFSNNNKLPLKKRNGSTFENPCFNFMKQPDTQNNPWIQKQQTMNSAAGTDGHLQKPEAKKARILPGVIRHTSCPDRSLAYYYNYSIH